MPTTPRQQTPTTLSRRTGLAYLGIIATGIVAEFAIRGSLVVVDDPTATARNIADAPGLFGAGIAADVVMVALDVAVAIGLFRLLRHVDRRLAITATVLRLVQGAVIALGLFSLVQALGFALQAADGAGSVDAGAAADAMAAVERHALVYDAGLIAFGLACLVLARVLGSARMVSRPLAIGLAATGVVYLVGSLAALFAPSLAPVVDPLYFVAIVVEPAFAIRLIRGFRTPTPNVDAAVPVPATAPT